MRPPLFLRMLPAIVLPLLLALSPVSAKPEAATPADKPEIAADTAKNEAGAAPKKEKVDQEEPETPLPAKKTKPGAAETYVVNKAPLIQKIKVSGSVESTRETPVELNLQRWSDLTVIRAAPHGTKVKTGDLLVELETKDLKKKIEELKLAMPTSELELSAAERELERAEKSTPLLLAKSLRDKMQAEQDLAHFEDIGRPLRERGAKEEVNEIGESLAYAEEELNQLKKMYEQDDLTEETEEIVLRRAENTVLRYRWRLEQTEARTARTLDTVLPREHESLKTNLELQQLDWRGGEKSLREDLEKKRLAAAAKRREINEQKKNLDELEADLAALRVTAPHDGIVYYGMSQRGKWTTAAVVERKLIPGGKLTMREIVMTVVDPAKVRVRLTLPEEQLTDLAEGQRGSLHLKWKPDYPFAARVEFVLHVPYADKTFDAILSVKTSADAPALFPGMTANAEIVVYEKKDALAIPKHAVQKEGDKESVTGADGKTIPVKTGHSDDKRIEILEGLDVGAVIRLPPPESEPKPKSGDKSATETPE